VSVIDTATKSVTATVTVTALPKWVAANSTAAFVAHDNLSFGSTLISVIRHSDNSVTTFDPGFPVRGFTMSSDGSKLYASGEPGTVWVIDTATKASTLLFDLGEDTFPESLTLSPDEATLYVADGRANRLYVIDVSSRTLTTTVVTSPSSFAFARDVAVSPDGAFVYVVNQSANSLSVVDTSTNSVVETVAVGNSPAGVAVSSDGSLVFVTNYVGNSLTVISPCTAP
jgi:YVTN family beta-propeller protein